MRGIATFPDLAVHARAGEKVRFTAECQRQVLDNVEKIPVITHDATIRTLTINTITKPAGRKYAEILNGHGVKPVVLSGRRISPQVKIHIVDTSSGVKNYTISRSSTLDVQCKVQLAAGSEHATLVGNTHGLMDRRLAWSRFTR